MCLSRSEECIKKFIHVNMMMDNHINSKYERLVRAVQELSLARDLESVMKIVRVVARELTGADGATFILRDKDQCFYADEDAITPLWKGNRFPMERCISGWVMKHSQSVVIEDVYTDNRIPHEVYKPTFVKSLALVPIRSIDPIGAIGNYWATPYALQEDDLTLLRSLADTTAVALENIKIYQDLEQRVRDRTRQLEDANAELEAIAYSLSHDLRSPLRHMSFHLDSLSAQLSTEDKFVHSLTTKLAKKVTGMQSLITDMLTMFQVGKQELKKSFVKMTPMIEEIFEELTEGSDTRKITLDITPDLPEAYVDKILIRQVWANLISNAIKYTGLKPEAYIKIGCQEREDGIVYCIEDNGDGFDMNHYNKVFQPFQRLHSASIFEGTGVGLAIVDRVIKRHKGNLWANSETGKGSTFYFSIPKPNEQVT